MPLCPGRGHVTMKVKGMGRLGAIFFLVRFHFFPPIVSNFKLGFLFFIDLWVYHFSSFLFDFNLFLYMVCYKIIG